jgi:hypothetical protein
VKLETTRYLFILGLCNDAISGSDCIISNFTMINEYMIGKGCG